MRSTAPKVGRQASGPGDSGGLWMWGQARKDGAVSSSASRQRCHLLGAELGGKGREERKGRAGEGSGAAWSFRCCAFKDASMYQMRG